MRVQPSRIKWCPYGSQETKCLPSPMWGRWEGGSLWIGKLVLSRHGICQCLDLRVLNLQKGGNFICKPEIYDISVGVEIDNNLFFHFLSYLFYLFIYCFLGEFSQFSPICLLSCFYYHIFLFLIVPFVFLSTLYPVLVPWMLPITIYFTFSRGSNLQSLSGWGRQGNQNVWSKWEDLGFQLLLKQTVNQSAILKPSSLYLQKHLELPPGVFSGIGSAHGAAYWLFPLPVQDPALSRPGDLVTLIQW